MKLFIVTISLALALLCLIIGLDILMGIPKRGIIWKAITPFRVMEPAEYIIVTLFFLFFFIKAIMSFLKKRKSSSTPN
ncbi:hypothetical protein BAVI_16182 [Neobacillus vireti LMG 21834]|uniref:Lipoprotein n=1 Tax=Neobacillus vireti LMG 21834 TaxID=1131730 RepID=A0AB94IL06_9BACI|nr:hypothetical protein BAVI_16182 [Neobacillus vireti LMG 21834]KLT19776.1 hypothetical protein AA980_04185 [Neobacillus vireti]